MHPRPLALVLSLSFALAACDDGGGSGAGDAGPNTADAATFDTGFADDGGARFDATTNTDLGVGADLGAETDLGAQADLGADGGGEGDVILAAEPKAYSGGTCPVFEAGENTITAAGAERSFDLYLPDAPEGAPLLFMWHPLGSNAGQVAAFLGAAAAARSRGYVIVVPESQRTATEWGYVGNATPDLTLFDDLLTCLTRQYGLDHERVYTTGFSAGALWSSYLVIHRAEYLAAAVILSGGTNQFLRYDTPAYRIPVLLAWGGPNDQYGGVINFQDATYAFRDALRADDHTVVMCGHQGGHTPPRGVADWGYEFLELHSVRNGLSPIDTDGLGPEFPDICSVAE